MEKITLFIKVTGFSALLSLFMLPLQGCGTSERIVDATLTEEQQNLRNELFQTADDQLEHLRTIQADILSPENFETGINHYERAELLLIQDRGHDRITAELRQAEEAFQKARQTAEVGEVTFRTAIEARNDALKAKAPVFASNNWIQAEAEFRRAAEFMEADNVARARTQAQVAERQFRDVELQAIKANFLDAARDTMRKAESEQAQRNAPQTFAKAKAEIRDVEAMLAEDRYDTEAAGRLARQASYRASYALHLNREISRMRSENKTFEDLFLEAEKPLMTIGEELDVDIRMDAGFDAPAEAIVSAIRSQRDAAASRLADVQLQLRELSRENEQLADALRRQHNELEYLRDQVDQKGDLAALLEVQRRRNEAIQSVRDLIPPDDGDVFLDGNNVLIRLHGLSFPVGQSIIEPRYFQLLRRVQDAIKLFPDGKISIEGHTDSRGSLELNQRLSEERADAVAQYIRANIGTAVTMSSVGFGPERPVASNETEAGRALNRRIDIVITPAWSH